MSIGNDPGKQIKAVSNISTAVVGFMSPMMGVILYVMNKNEIHSRTNHDFAVEVNGG